MNMLAETPGPKAFDGCSGFAIGDFPYVDKTEQLYNLLTHYPHFSIARPHRFGKSLLLETIGRLFEQGVDPCFKGTWIYDHWKYPTYPVLRINCAAYSVTDVKAYAESFSADIAAFAQRLGLEELDCSRDPGNTMQELFYALDERRVVILIDDYDTQLIASASNPELYTEFRKCLHYLHAVMKGQRQIWRTAMTSVSNLKESTLFSAVTDVLDVSYKSFCADLLGLTREEIVKYYLADLKQGVSHEQHKAVEQVTSDDLEELLDRLEEYYGGYCFDEDHKKKVFSPYSVQEFLRHLRSTGELNFESYWVRAESARSEMQTLLDFPHLPIDRLDRLLSGKLWVDDPSFRFPDNLQEINRYVLLFQAGYLTLTSKGGYRNNIILGPANRELKTFLCDLLSQRLFVSEETWGTSECIRPLDESRVEELIFLFNHILSQVNSASCSINSEAEIRGLILLYLNRQDIAVSLKIHYTSRGVLLMEGKQQSLMLALKYTETEHEVTKLLSEATEQLISKDYDIETPPSRRLLKLACVFSGADTHRKIVAWQQID